MKVEVKIDYMDIKVLIDNILFLCIDRGEYIGLQSWSNGNGHYCIEFYTKTNNILTEYDNKEKWLQMLEALNEEL